MSDSAALELRRQGTAVRNRLLRALPAEELERLRPRLQPVALPLRTVLARPGHPVEVVYFLESGSVSMIVDLSDGARVEVGLVGAEGLVGLSLLLGAATSPLQALVQIEGTALKLPAAAFRDALAESPALLALLLQYADSFQFQVAQGSACNSRHLVEQRLARWLLMEHDRAGGDGFPITQEFMSTMLGVGRPAVTVAMGALQRAGLVRTGRGSVRVVNRPGLESASCECYAAVRRRFAWLTDAG